MSERIAVVTGGTRGIGAATAALLRAQGWSVTVTGLTEAEVAAAGEGAEVLDVTDDRAVAALFARFERLDGLVTSAGMVAREAEWEIPAFARVVDVNLTGTMRAALAAHPALKRAGGSVVTIASIMGYVSNPAAPAYAASKAGVINLTRALAARWAPDGIRVNAVAPGYVETAMTEKVRKDNAVADALLQRQKLGRWGRPEEIAELIVWLLSDKASFVTGSTHLADGGFLTT
jgi:NAD(P)-dependent dehydrogenase (short-subunit alcohol dehydrogenase family)